MESSVSTFFPFLRLPWELRHGVYRLCLPQDQHIELSYDNATVIYKRCFILRTPPRAMLRRFSSIDSRSLPGWPVYQPGYRPAYESWKNSSSDGRCNKCKHYPAWPDLPSKGNRLGNKASSTHFCVWCHRYLPGYPTHMKSALPGLLIICRQINEEAEALLYSGNDFRLVNMGSAGSLYCPLGLGRRKKIRRLFLALDAWADPPQPSVDSLAESLAEWDSILKVLPKIGIIVVPSCEEWDDFLVVEEWLAGILKHVVRAISQDTPIVIETIEEDKVSSILEKANIRRYVFQKIALADCYSNPCLSPHAQSRMKYPIKHFRRHNGRKHFRRVK